MEKLKLEIDSLQVQSFEPDAARGTRGTVRGHLTAYYEICYDTDTWQVSCTCEPTCNARTCYQCPSAGCPTAGCPNTDNLAACTGSCVPITNPAAECQ